VTKDTRAIAQKFRPVVLAELDGAGACAPQRKPAPSISRLGFAAIVISGVLIGIAWTAIVFAAWLFFFVVDWS
jgi:hypothetical protein